jgi:hypothetical protein
VVLSDASHPLRAVKPQESQEAQATPYTSTIPPEAGAYMGPIKVREGELTGSDQAWVMPGTGDGISLRMQLGLGGPGQGENEVVACDPPTGDPTWESCGSTSSAGWEESPPSPQALHMFPRTRCVR